MELNSGFTCRKNNQLLLFRSISPRRWPQWEQARLNSESHSPTPGRTGPCSVIRPKNRIANAANLSALLFMEFGDVSGPIYFCGRQTCPRRSRASPLRGYSDGKEVRSRCDPHQPARADVHSFPGHIACDVSARSEVVVPLILHGVLIGVLDIDSSTLKRFDPQDQELIEQLAEIYLNSID
jgi:GAF domain-containing protein